MEEGHNVHVCVDTHSVMVLPPVGLDYTAPSLLLTQSQPVVTGLHHSQCRYLHGVSNSRRKGAQDLANA